MKKRSLPKTEKNFMARIIQKNNFFPFKLNVFDLLFLLVVALVLVFFLYNRLQRQSVWVNMRVSVQNSDWWYGGDPPQYWYAANLQVGDLAYDSFGNTVAEVINIDNYDQGGPYRYIFVDLRVKVDYSKKRQQYSYDFKPLTIGSSVAFTFNQQQLMGLIIKLDEEEITYREKEIVVSSKGLEPGLADLVEVGKKSLTADGSTIAEIIAVERNPYTYYQYSDIRGRTMKVTNPDLWDLLITLRIKTFDALDRTFYVNGAVVKVGSNLWFQFPDFALENTIIKAILN